MQTWGQRGAFGLALLLLGSARAASAAGLGIPLDGFLTTFTTWVIGLGFLIGIVGLAGFVASHMDNSFSPLLSGSVGFFTRAGLLGGGTAIFTAMGLVAGATLP
jgi:hypothetical protein